MHKVARQRWLCPHQSSFMISKTNIIFDILKGKMTIESWFLEWERKLTSCNQRACYLACLLWLPSLREDTSKISQKLLTLKSAKHYLNSLSLQKINQKSPGNNSFKTRGLIAVAIRGLQSKKYGNMQNTATQHSWKIKKHGGDTTIN